MTPRHKNKQRDEIMQNTRGRLLEAAAVEFAQRGYEGANVNRIAQAAGFSVGTLYNHFPTKRKLMQAFIDEVAGKHVEHILTQVKSTPDPVQRVKEFFRAGFSFVETYTTQARAIFTTLNGPDEEFKTHLFQAYLPFFQLLNEEIISLGVQRGVFRQVNPVETANLLMLIYLGTGSQFSPEGRLWLSPMQVANFVLEALCETEIGS